MSACRREKKHLFIVCPNQSGSSMIYRYLNKCRYASIIDGEGQLSWGSSGPVNMVGPYKDYYFSEYAEQFADTNNYNWVNIKTSWQNGWNKNVAQNKKQGVSVFVEKSPPNVFRIHLLKEQFVNPYFILSIRCPYAMCEGMRRHVGYDLSLGAKHWGKCARQQIKNIKSAIDNNNGVFYRYQDFCTNPEPARLAIVGMIPELDDLSFSGQVAVHSIEDITGQTGKNVFNFNEKQYANLTSDDLCAINKVLDDYQEEMEYFKYERRH